MIARLFRRVRPASRSVATPDPELAKLQARAAALQAQAASGCKGCASIRRELHIVRHEILARELQA